MTLRRAGLLNSLLSVEKRIWDRLPMHDAIPWALAAYGVVTVYTMFTGAESPAFFRLSFAVIATICVFLVRPQTNCGHTATRPPPRRNA